MPLPDLSDPVGKVDTAPIRIAFSIYEYLNETRPMQRAVTEATVTMSSLSAKARRLLSREAARADAVHASQTWQEELALWEPESSSDGDEDEDDDDDGDSDSVHRSDDETSRPSSTLKGKKKKKAKGLYQAVRVILLSWDSSTRTETMQQQTIMQALRSLFQNTFRFAVHTVRLPGSEGAQTPDGFLMEYLLRNNLLDRSDARNTKDELVILVYDGSSVLSEVYDASVGLTGSNAKESLFLTHPGGHMRMPFDWLEKRLAHAPYHSLIIMNCRYNPCEVLDRQIGVNMVLAAVGPNLGFGSEFKKEKTDEAQDKTSTEGESEYFSCSSDSSLGFLETLLIELSKPPQNGPKRLSVKDLYERVLKSHDADPGEPFPFCDFVSGKKKIEDESKDMLYFEPLRGVDRDGWQVLGEGDGELDEVDSGTPVKGDSDLLLVSDSGKEKAPDV
ncbi:hypothetical protein QBC43DRAFT_292089 [Cladorrhinum sp. PSN259]|nr:hypothetical protein QBC43DRAFT_292089 [Cladorrhinum sp. PSN259]